MPQIALRRLCPKFNFGKQLRLNPKCRDELFAIEQIKYDQHDLGRSALSVRFADLKKLSSRL
jgi:hypothetical protein